VSISAALSPDQARKLKVGISAIDAVSRLPQAQFNTLLNELVSRLPYAVLAQSIVPQGLGSKRGPKPKLALPIVLIDCVKSWDTATKATSNIWETVPGISEAVPCTIARVVIQVMRGLDKPYAGALHRAIKTARGMLDEPQTTLL
jgi:hypothetical protein